MKHEHALLSFKGEAEQGARNVGIVFVVRGGVGVEVVVVAPVDGTASRARRFAEGEDIVHSLVLVRGSNGGEGRECECVFVIISSSVLFIPSVPFFPIHLCYTFLFQVERSRKKSTHKYEVSVIVTIG
jgi:hypothetical protein